MAYEGRAAINRYCPVEGQMCSRQIAMKPFPSFFLAYPNSTYWTQFFLELRRELSVRGVDSLRWQDSVTGSVIFPKICEALHAHSHTLAELTELNGNVLFETGYALAAGRQVVILLDRTKVSNPLPILPTKQHCYYSTREDIHAWLNKYLQSEALRLASSPAERSPSVMEMNGISEALERPGTLYYLRPRIQTQTIKAVGDELKRISQVGKLQYTTSDPMDAAYDQFYEQVRQIKESEYVVGLLVNQRTRDAVQNNAPVILLLGVAAGFGKTMLVLQESPHDSLIDLGTLLRPFEGERTAREYVKQWLQPHLDAAAETNRREVRSRWRAVRENKVRDLYLGQPDAMIDYDLMDYFVQTAQYDEALRGVKQLFIGRKGAGKSATYRALAAEISKRQRSILVKIAPTEFQFERLTGLFVDQYGELNWKYVCQTFWRYIFFTETLRAVGARYAYFQQMEQQPHIARIFATIRELEDDLDEDFATRANRKLVAVKTIPPDQSNVALNEQLADALNAARMYRVERDLQRLARDYQIHVLIDDVDKYWNPTYQASINLLLGLVNESAQQHERFQGNLTASIFLRQDIFDVLRSHDEELVKRNISLLRWDEASLLQMIAERIAVKTNTSLETDEEMWSAVFPATVGTKTASTYMIERTLQRPRDLLKFCQYSVEKAQAHRHPSVLDSDVLDAEKPYSEYMFEAMKLEYLHMYPRLEEVMLEFGKWRAQGPWSEAVDFVKSTVLIDPHLGTIEWVSECGGSAEKLLETLYQVGFCGLEDADRGLLFYSHLRSFRDARALCYRRPYVHIHPAFHSALYLDQ